MSHEDFPNFSIFDDLFSDFTANEIPKLPEEGAGQPCTQKPKPKILEEYKNLAECLQQVESSA